jgi:hypothetical protein
MSALVEQARAGGLAATKVRGLATLAEGILRVQGVAGEGSRLAFLRRDLALVMAQIHRRAGRHWQSAWEQTLAARHAAQASDASIGVDLVAAGRRLLRLGHARLALAKLDAASAFALTPRNRLGVAVARVQALRLAGRLDAAAAAIEAARASPSLPDEAPRELAWEALCVAAQRTGDVAPLVAASGRRGTHHESTYFLETFCWTKASPTRGRAGRLPMVRSAARTRSLGATKAGLFFRCALTLEDAYETEAPMSTRLANVGAMLGRSRALVSVDKELLVWAASARWLMRAHAPELAALALGEYETLSRRLTSGASADALGVAADMLDRPWYVATAGADASDDELPAVG